MFDLTENLVWWCQLNLIQRFAYWSTVLQQLLYSAWQSRKVCVRRRRSNEKLQNLLILLRPLPALIACMLSTLCVQSAINMIQILPLAYGFNTLLEPTRAPSSPSLPSSLLSIAPQKSSLFSPPNPFSVLPSTEPLTRSAPESSVLTTTSIETTTSQITTSTLSQPTQDYLTSYKSLASTLSIRVSPIGTSLPPNQLGQNPTSPFNRTDCPDQSHWIFTGVLAGLVIGLVVLWLFNCFKLTPADEEPQSN